MGQIEEYRKNKYLKEANQIETKHIIIWEHFNPEHHPH